MSLEGSIAAVGLVVVAPGVLLSVRAANARVRIRVDGTYDAPRPGADRTALVLIGLGLGTLAIAGMVYILKGLTALATF